MPHFISLISHMDYPKNPPVPAGLRKRILARPTDSLPFLHDTSIATGGLLSAPLAAWYACTQGEIAGETSIRGCRIASGHTCPVQETLVSGSDFHYVPVSLLPVENGTYAFVTRMTDHDLPVGYCVLKDSSHGWQCVADWPDPVLINTNPIPLGDDHFLAAGRLRPEDERYPIIPALFLLHRSALSPETSAPGHWTVIPIQAPDTPAMFCPETTVFVHRRPNGWLLTALSRATQGRPHVHTTHIARPEDLPSAVWQYEGLVPLPIAPVKMYAFTLPDGTDCLLYNRETIPESRSQLHMALRAPGDFHFTRIYTLADGFDVSLNAGPFWHYPCAALSGDTLLITCTANDADNRRSAVLMEIPLSSLI